MTLELYEIFTPAFFEETTMKSRLLSDIQEVEQVRARYAKKHAESRRRRVALSGRETLAVQLSSGRADTILVHASKAGDAAKGIIEAVVSWLTS